MPGIHRPRHSIIAGRSAIAVAMLLALVAPSVVLAHQGGEPFIHAAVDHVIPGEPFPIIGADLDPDLPVALLLTLQGEVADLGSVVAGPDGHFETTSTAPVGFPEGYAELVATSEGGLTARAFVRVSTEPAVATPTAPATGGGSLLDDPSIWLFGALIAAAVIGLLVIATRPRRTTT